MIPNLHHAVIAIQLLIQRVFPAEIVGKPLVSFYTDNGQFVVNAMFTANTPFGPSWSVKPGTEFKGIGVSYESAANNLLDRLVSLLKEKQGEDLQVLNLVEYTKRLNAVETKGVNPPTFELPTIR